MHNNDTDLGWNATSGWRLDAAARVLSDEQIETVRKNMSQIPTSRNTGVLSLVPPPPPPPPFTHRNTNATGKE